MLQNSSPLEVTLISNLFIDQYMPKANGEFVKVYLFLLRMLGQPSSDFALEEMADRLACTEKDIVRALKYWENEKLISLTCDSKGELTRISLSGLTKPAASDSRNDDALGFEKQASLPPSSVPMAEKSRTSLTPDRVKELKKNEDVVQLLYITEQYLGKTLSPTEMQKILYFYDELHMSTDLIDFLIEHCVGRGHKSMRYIETVALAWAQEGITTVEMAKNACSRYAREYYTILKSMGITNRSPVDTEAALMDTWMKDYGFTMDIIQEACSRTVLQTGQPSFQYADKILLGWKKKNVKHLEDIRVLDAEHKKRKLARSTSQNPPAAPKTANRFNNFHQREYDFEEYEKRLLNK